MGKIGDSITPELERFIAEQSMFFVGTAPLAESGHVNLSPKGLDTFRVLDPRRVGYLDLTGSGNETAAHVLENRRITFMFCSFGKSPQILRLYGRAVVVSPGSPDWEQASASFPALVGRRQVIIAEVDSVQTSCGFGVPRMQLVESRDTLLRWAEKKGEDGLASYRSEKNARSLDGLPTGE